MWLVFLLTAINILRCIFSVCTRKVLQGGVQCVFPLLLDCLFIVYRSGSVTLNMIFCDNCCKIYMFAAIVKKKKKFYKQCIHMTNERMYFLLIENSNYEWWRWLKNNNNNNNNW